MPSGDSILESWRGLSELGTVSGFIRMLFVGDMGTPVGDLALPFMLIGEVTGVPFGRGVSVWMPSPTEVWGVGDVIFVTRGGPTAGLRLLAEYALERGGMGRRALRTDTGGEMDERSVAFDLKAELLGLLVLTTYSHLFLKYSLCDPIRGRNN
jgi:hypothetical protein